MNYTLIPADTEARPQAIALLAENNLPVADLDNNKQLYILLDDGRQVIGTGGLEFFNDAALVRSVSVKSTFRGKGLGKLITHELERVVLSKGIRSLYLLTTTAKDFFEKERYWVVERSEVPSSIKESSEFSSVCPATATVMKKEL